MGQCGSVGLGNLAAESPTHARYLQGPHTRGDGVWLNFHRQTEGHSEQRHQVHFFTCPPMMRRVSDLLKLELRARDGVLGQVRDLHFDDERWVIRYLVVETGTWLNSRKVLIATSVVDAADWALGQLPVNLTQEQVRKSPGVDTEQPVTRQQETGLSRHYGWPIYWDNDPSLLALAGACNGANARVFATASAPTLTALGALPAPPVRKAPDGNPRLRRASAVRGYRLEAIDGPIGHIDDFLFEELTWEITFIAIETGIWWSGRKALISPEWVSAVSWARSRVYLDLTREGIRTAPAYDPHNLPDEGDARRLRRHHFMA